MITDDYNNGPRVVRKDYVLWKIQNMKESAFMPSFCMWPISVFNQEPCGFEIETKELCFGQSLLPLKMFQKEHIYILDLKYDCFFSGVVNKLYIQFEALTVRTNDYV